MIQKAENIIFAYFNSIKLLYVFILILLLSYVFSGFRIVRQDEQAVVYSFGKIRTVANQPGIAASLPYPFGYVSTIKSRIMNTLVLQDWRRDDNTQLQKNTLNPIKDVCTLTGDINLVHGIFQLRYRISDPVNYEKAGLQTEEILKKVAYSNISKKLAKHPVDELTTNNRIICSTSCLEGIRKDVTKLQLGIEVDAFDVLDLSPPIALKNSFDSVTSAHTEANLIENQAILKASETIENAKTDYHNLILRSQAAREKSKIEAKAWVERFLLLNAQSQVQPEVFAREYWNAKITTVLKKCRLEAVLPTQGQDIRIIWKPRNETRNE